MRKRIYTSEYGRLTGDRRFPMGFATPETTKIYYLKYTVPMGEETTLPEISANLKWWAFGSHLYRYPVQDGAGLELVDSNVGDFVGKGQTWMLLATHLLVEDRILPSTLPYPVPDIRACLVDPWVRQWEFGGHLNDAPLYLPSLGTSNSWIAGRWGYCPVQFRFVRENIDYHALEEYIKRIQNPYTVKVFREKLAALKPTVIARPNASSMYCFDWYDTVVDATTDEISFDLARYGGAWTKSTELFTHGSKTFGRGYLIPAMFQGDGTCLGFAGINNGILKSEDEAVMLPTVNGVLLLNRDIGPRQAGMVPIRLPFSSWDKDTLEVTTYPIGQKGTTQGDGYATGDGLGLFHPYLYFTGENLLRGIIPPLHGDPEFIYGGSAETMDDWISSMKGILKRVYGPFLHVGFPHEDRVIDVRSMRRHILPGHCMSVVTRDGVCWANTSSISKDPANDKSNGQIRVHSTPLGKVDPKYQIQQQILPEHVIAPWCMTVGEPLELGWWDFPQINIKGSPPNLEWINKSWEGEELWMNGSGDHIWGDIGWTRTSLSITSDGYVNITADIGKGLTPGKVMVAGFKYNGASWKCGRADFQVSDSRVAPLGQGCYYTYHFPGEDWSIFHAPVGDVQYRRLWQPTDWSFLWALTGLAGGWALAGQLSIQDAFNKYMEASMGNLMLIYTLPRQLMAIGDPLFQSSHVITQEDPHFWTFVGWARIGDQPKAIFSKIADMGANNPEVWAVGKYGASQINPSEAGEVGEKAFGLIPSNYYPRWGLYPGATPSDSGWDLIFPGETYHYPMPDFPQGADTALAQQYLDNLKEWESRAANINRPRVVVGQSTNHQILDSAVIDPSVPLLDVRVQQIDGVTWVLLQHACGIWFSVRGDVSFERYDFESVTGWQLLSLGVERDGTVVALFQEGLINQDTYRTPDRQMAIYFGMGNLWQYQSIYKWPARIIPVVVAQNVDDLAKLGRLFPKNKEE